MEKQGSVNKMGVEPIKPLMLGMGIPMILSMVLQALYNIVDSYFVSCISGTDLIPNMGDYAVNALTLAFPVQMLIVAVGVGTGVGVNTLLSRSIGQGDHQKANKIAGNALFIAVCTYLVFLIFGLFGIDAYIGSQTSDTIVYDMTKTYLSICVNLSFGSVIFMVIEKLLQSTGRTMLSTTAQVLGAVTNIILDPILIFGLCGFSEMGIAGAAYATIIGQIVSCVIGLIFHLKFNRDIHMSFNTLIPSKTIIKEIYQIGIPAILMQAIMSFMTYGVNIIFGTLSSTVVTAYGVYYKIQQFVFFAAFGMNNAIIPIVSFNYGKQDKKRVQEGIKWGLYFTLIIMLIGLILLQVFAKPIISIFALSSETQVLCIRAIRIITLGYLFVGANIAYQGIFQALGKGVHSLILSLLRLIIIALPLAWIFTKSANAQYLIWFAFPIAELLAFIVGFIFMKRISKEKIEPLDDEFTNAQKLNVEYQN